MFYCTGNWGFHHVPVRGPGWDEAPNLHQQQTWTLLQQNEWAFCQLLLSDWGWRVIWVNEWKICLKGLLWPTSLSFLCCASASSYFLVVKCTAAISSPHLSYLRWASCLLWGLRIWQGTGNSQVTGNKWDCFFVYQISHHNVNSEPSSQPKPPAQLPNCEDVRLQKQVCKECRQKAPTPLSSPTVLLSSTVSGTHRFKRGRPG